MNHDQLAATVAHLQAVQQRIVQALRDQLGIDLGDDNAGCDVKLPDIDRDARDPNQDPVTYTARADYRCVEGDDGSAYYFSPLQAACLRIIWAAHKAGHPEIHHSEVLRQSQSFQVQLSHIFRAKRGFHEAWGTVIVKARIRGCYRIAGVKVTGGKS